VGSRRPSWPASTCAANECLACFCIVFFCPFCLLPIGKGDNRHYWKQWVCDKQESTSARGFVSVCLAVVAAFLRLAPWSAALEALALQVAWRVGGCRQAARFRLMSISGCTEAPQLFNIERTRRSKECVAFFLSPDHGVFRAPHHFMSNAF